MIFSREAVLAAVRAAFPEDRWPHVMGLLDAYGVEPYERERERVQLGIVKLSRGSEIKLDEYLAAAKVDYRDILLWADEPAASRLDAKQRKAALDGLKQLGFNPNRRKPR